MKRKKIVLTANTDWYIYNFRKELIVSLLENNWEVIIISPYGKYVDNLIELGCSHIPWKVGRQSINPLPEWSSIRKLKQIFLSLEPTLIHQHTLKAVLYGNFAARKSQIPTIR